MSQPQIGDSHAAVTYDDVKQRRFPRVAPQHGLLYATLFVIAVAGLSAWLTAHTPWLGIDLGATDKGLTVTDLDPAGPAASTLRVGDVIAAIVTQDGSQLPLTDAALLEDPDDLPTFAQYNNFFLYQEALDQALHQPSVTLVLLDGQRLTIQPAPYRPLNDFSLDYWLTVLCGLGGFLIGVGVWTFRRGEIATRILMLCGTGLLIAALTTSVYGGRELALDAEIFRYASQLNRLGITLFAVSALILQFYYPERLSRFPVALTIYGFFALVLINEYAQWLQPPVHAFKMQFSLIYCGAIVPAVWQWRRTRGRPLARAALQWFLLAIFGSMGIGMSAYMVPYTLGYEPLISMTTAFVIGLTMFIGLALGILRYRLFDLERWWFEAWAWFFGGMLVVVADATLVYSLGVAPTPALGAALLLVGWIYFPARQWMWGIVTHGRKSGLEHHVPIMLEAFFSAHSTADFPAKWRGLLKRVFTPLEIKSADGDISKPSLHDNGMVLMVPSLTPGEHLDLHFAGQGRRLFSSGDVRLAQSMLDLADRALNLKNAQERGVQRERERIMRDLHDDVAAKLLTLAHRADTPANAETARSALRSLREAIYSLDDTASIPLEDFLSDTLSELRERLDAARVELFWRENQVPAVDLLPRQRINLKRIIAEVVSNAIRHGSPKSISVDVGSEGSHLAIRVCDDGMGGDPSIWTPGKGLNNIRTRTEELGGQVAWQPGDNDHGCCVSITIPTETA